MRFCIQKDAKKFGHRNRALVVFGAVVVGLGLGEARAACDFSSTITFTLECTEYVELGTGNYLFFDDLGVTIAADPSPELGSLKIEAPSVSVWNAGDFEFTAPSLTPLSLRGDAVAYFGFATGSIKGAEIGLDLTASNLLQVEVSHSIIEADRSPVQGSGDDGQARVPVPRGEGGSAKRAA